MRQTLSPTAATPREQRAATLDASHAARPHSGLDLVGLLPVMERTTGNPAVRIGLVDGPVAGEHADLAGANIFWLSDDERTACDNHRLACVHGTFVAGILGARRTSPAPGICPDCTILARPLFTGDAPFRGVLRSTPAELARALVECVDAGARVLNVSASVTQASASSERALRAALDHARARGAIVVAAAGNDASIGGSVLTSHPAVIPVVACDRQGRPTTFSNLGHSIGRRGLRAPGDRITSLGPHGRSVTLSGTSAAAPFVTGAIALLWSAFPGATVVAMRQALAARSPARPTISPPLLNAWAAYQAFLR